MKKPKVNHKLAYSSILERTDTYIMVYEETYCGHPKKYIIDEPLTEKEFQKRARENAFEAARVGEPCKSCMAAFERANGKLQ